MDSHHLYEHAHCHYFTEGRCNSCDLLAIAPGQRIAAKERRALASLSKYGITPTSIEPLRLPHNPWGSRCKIKMNVTGTIHSPVIGVVRSDLSSVDLSECPLTPIHIQKLILSIKEIIKESALTPYDIKHRAGELKNIIIMSNHDASQGIVRFVLRSSEAISRMKKQVPRLQAAHPWVRVISCNIQPIPAAILEGPDEEILTQERTIEVRYNNTLLSFLPQSFMQVTHEIAEALYYRAATYVQGRSYHHALDLFCGVGGFSLSIGHAVKKITGVEVSPMAIESAQNSARRLGMNHASFYADDVEGFLNSPLVGAPDLVIVNPPRRGLSTTICEQILRISPDTILYSSCNPETFAQDVTHLSASYTAHTVAPFDMFAMTDHCEILGILERRP